MVIERGGVYWADLGPAIGSRPAKRRPVLVVQADGYNQSGVATVVVAVLTSNTALALMPGNVFLPEGSAGLAKDSVVNVTALFTLNKTDLGERAGAIDGLLLEEVNRGLRRVLGL